MTEILLNHVVQFNVIQSIFMEIGWAYLFTLLISCNSDEQPDFIRSNHETNSKSITCLQKSPQKIRNGIKPGKNCLFYIHGK